MEYFVITLWLLLTVGDVIATADERLQQGYGLQNHIYGTFFKVGLRQCAEMCLTSTSCLSINYFRHGLLCLLNDGDKNSYPNDYVMMSGSSYGDRSELDQNFGGSCTVCPPHHTCIKLTASGSKVCIRTECDNYPSLTNGKLLSSSAWRRVGSVLTFGCKSGYLLAGTSTKTCKASGQWTADELSCIDCGDPPSIDNASVNPGNNTINSNRTYTCNHGYYKERGRRNIVCKENAHWSSTGLLCTSDTE